jgi:hypothetical protein
MSSPAATQRVLTISLSIRGSEVPWKHKNRLTGGFGRLAQLGERLPYKQEVACSSHAPPISSTTDLPGKNSSGMLPSLATSRDYQADSPAFAR